MSTRFFIAFTGSLAGHTPFASNLTLRQACKEIRAAGQRWGEDVELLADVTAHAPEVQLLRDAAVAARDEGLVRAIDLAREGNAGALRRVRRALAAAAVAAE